MACLSVLASCARATSSRARAEEAVAGFSVSPHIVVDQFGYLPGDPKVAVIRSAEVGFDRGAGFSPGGSYEVRDTRDGRVMLRGEVRAWNAGLVQPSSGDRGWWFDFSALTLPGRYVVVDAMAKLRSPAFSIDSRVYRPVLQAAMRTYYYQRSGMAKTRPYAQECWTDAAAYLGPGQDSEAHDVTDRDNPAKVRDLRGGWFDAGDTNKYVTFAAPPVHQLLNAYERHPDVFTDDFNIPESGNGIPDLIDEVKWEIDWLERMQFDDGRVALKVGGVKVVNPSPPSSDRSARFYVPACTSATIAAAGMFAHAAYDFARFPPLAKYAQDLAARAVRAWDQFQKVPVQTHCDTGVVLAGNADRSAEQQSAEAVEAAIYLAAVTSEPRFYSYVQAHYREMRPYRDIGWSRYDADQGESLLFFTRLGAAPPGLRAAILADKERDVQAGNQIYGFEPNDDLYRAFMHDAQYHWGSNQPRANYGNTNLDVVTYGLAGQEASRYRQRALEILHYFHGVNPLGMTYLSNMYSLGATRAANQIFHAWYQQGSRWSDALGSECGPAPGFVPGGPNVNAVKDGVPAGMAPPAGQPPQKSYRDWNGMWPDSSWAVTEPAIYYQGAYVELLAAFVQ